MSPRCSVALAALAGLALRLTVALGAGVRPAWDGVLYARAARHLADGGGFTQRIYDPAWWPSPTGFFPPGWPALLSLVHRAGLPNEAALVLQALLGAFAIPLAAWLTARWIDRAHAPVAAWLVALWPGGVVMTASWMTEPLFGALALLALVPLVGRDRPALRVAGSALIFGVAALVRPVAIVLAPAAALGYALSVVRAPRRVALSLTALSLLALLPAAPWVARNASELGVASMTTSTGANLHVGVHGARFDRLDDDLDRGASEDERDVHHRRRARDEIAADPVGWLALAPLKLAHTFGYEASPALVLGAGRGIEAPDREPWVLAVAAFCSAFWLLLVAAAVVPDRRATAARAIATALALTVAVVHAVFFGGDRYHLPLVPLVAIAAAPTLVRWWRRTPIEPDGRLVGP